MTTSTKTSSSSKLWVKDVQTNQWIFIEDVAKGRRVDHADPTATAPSSTATTTTTAAFAVRQKIAPFTRPSSSGSDATISKKAEQYLISLQELKSAYNCDDIKNRNFAANSLQRAPTSARCADFDHGRRASDSDVCDDVAALAGRGREDEAVVRRRRGSRRVTLDDEADDPPRHQIQREEKMKEETTSSYASHINKSEGGEATVTTAAATTVTPEDHIITPENEEERDEEEQENAALVEFGSALSSGLFFAPDDDTFDTDMTPSTTTTHLRINKRRRLNRITTTTIDPSDSLRWICLKYNFDMPDLNEVDKLFPMMSVPTKRLRRPDDESNKVDEEARRRFPPGEITFEIGTTGEEVVSSLLSIGNNNGVVSHEDEEKKLSQTMEGVESSSSDEEKEDEEEYCQDYFSGSGCDNNNNNNGEIEEEDDDEEHMITKPADEERGGSSIKKSSTTSVTITRLIQSLENHASGGKKERPQAYCECSKCSLRTKSSAAAAAATTAVVVYHDKQPADTLESISLQYNVTPEMIRRANNNFLGDDLVCAPNRLVIPITTSTTTTTTTTTAVNTATATTPNQNHHETMTAKEQHGLTNHEKVEYLQSQLSKLSLSRDDAVSFLKLNDWNLSRSIRNVNIQKRFLSPRGSK